MTALKKQNNIGALLPNSQTLPRCLDVNLKSSAQCIVRMVENAAAMQTISRRQTDGGAAAAVRGWHWGR